MGDDGCSLASLVFSLNLATSLNAPPESDVAELAAALARAGVDLAANPLSAEQLGQLAQYCRLLWEWNAKINLTRHDTFDKFAARDFIDSFELAKLLEANEEVLDAGTGGGVPGIVVAVLRPDTQVSLCESVGKKAKAVQDMVQKLGLPVPVYHARAEDVLEDFRFTTIVARAVGPLSRMLRWFEPHWASIGRLLLAKGPKWIEERGEARHLGLMNRLDLRKVAEYPLTGTESNGVILQIKRR